MKPERKGFLKGMIAGGAVGTLVGILSLLPVTRRYQPPKPAPQEFPVLTVMEYDPSTQAFVTRSFFDRDMDKRTVERYKISG